MESVVVQISNMHERACAPLSLRLRDGHQLNLNTPLVMGVVNITTNSFYNPTPKLSDALQLAEKMVAEGASLLDVGGEATNPKINLAQDAPSVEQELARVIPLITAIKKKLDVLVSVDTSRWQVMQAAADAGADIINDQRALADPKALQVVADLKIPVCLMHFFPTKRQPGSMSFANLLLQIKDDLNKRVIACKSAGIASDQIIIDPGFGQGNYNKNCDENYYLLANLMQFFELQLPILIGWSRKSMIGDVLGVAANKRLYGSLSAALVGAWQGASIIRVHDVQATVEALKIMQYTRKFTEI